LPSNPAATPPPKPVAAPPPKPAGAKGVAIEGVPVEPAPARSGSSVRLVRRLETGDRVQSLAISPDGRTLAVGEQDTIEIWSAGGEKLATLNAHDGAVQALAFSPAADRLVT